MKKLLSLIVVAAAVLFAGTAKAQTYDVSSGTIYSNSVAVTAIAATSTNTLTSTPMLAHGQTLGVQAGIALAGAGTSAVVFKFDTSVDGTSWTANTYSISVTASGTNVLSGSASFAVGGMGFVRLSSIENPNAQTLTPTIKWARKNSP